MMSDLDNLKVFVSSTMADLQPERQAVRAAIEDLYLNPVFAEGFGARRSAPREECLRAVQESDLYIGLFWQRYGYITDRGISATEEEYRMAKEAGKPILVYVKEPAPERDVLLIRFLRELEDYASGHLRSTFSTVEQLRRQVKQDVMRVVSELARERDRQPPLRRQLDVPMGLMGTAGQPLPGKAILRKAIVAHFSLDDLETLCQDLEVEIRVALGDQGFPVSLEMVGGEGLEGKTRELINYLDRRDQLDRLVAAVRRERPGVI